MGQKILDRMGFGSENFRLYRILKRYGVMSGGMDMPTSVQVVLPSLIAGLLLMKCTTSTICIATCNPIPSFIQELTRPISVDLLSCNQSWGRYSRNYLITRYCLMQEKVSHYTTCKYLIQPNIG